MTREQLSEVASWRSSPLTSKTMWTIYVGQGSIAAFLAHVLIVFRDKTPTSVLLVGIGAIAALAITGVAGLAWTDPVVRIANAGKKEAQ